MAELAFPIAYYIEHAETLFGVPSGLVGGALFGQGGALTIGEASSLLTRYLGRLITATPLPTAMRMTQTIGDGSSNSFTIAHNLGSLAPAVIIWDLSQIPPAIIGAEVQSIDSQHINITAAAWEETPPPPNSISVTVIA